ncbi:protein-arginine deiminase family protein [Aurantiacibacter xanthus]|nr:protein-arginine deiminase family protein [Aurantiacibacter xanthus]
MRSCNVARRKMLLCGVAGAMLCASARAHAVEPEILADTNRDGLVDAADRDGKALWSDDRGAILLANIGDVANRCPKPAQTDLSDDELEACNDAQGEEARAPEYFAPVRVMPIADVAQGATGRVIAVGAGAQNIRVFVKRGEGWKFLAPTDRLSAEDLRAGLQLGVDARDVARDAAVWDGRITLELAVDAAGQTRSDRVAMRVAPVVLHNHTQNATRIFAVKSGRAKAHQQFVADLSSTLSQIGFQQPVEIIDTFDNWAQDFVEFGYMAMPAPEGAMKVIRVAIRSPQPTRSAGRALFDLRGPGVGVVQIGGDNYHQADSFGNLETVPPYETNGRRYPGGRVIYGDAGDGLSPHHDMVSFFEAQEVQDPILLDTSWLAIAHVDEFVQFLPTDNARGWVIAIKDVPSGLEVLRDAQRRGFGDRPAFSVAGGHELTIDDVLADDDLMRKNELARRRVELNLAILMAETGVTEDEVLRVPGLFHTAEFAVDPEDALTEGAPPPMLPPDLDWPREEIVYGPGTLIAYYPAAVNGVVVDRHNYIMPSQWGPVIDGVDLLGEAVSAAYAKLGITTWSVDDWRSHHVLGGEVHCGTNAMREIGDAWWR